MKKKLDRRIIYTKKIIKEVFLELLKQKPINKITVKELCENADINRATFYSHYKDLFDLLSKIEHETNSYLNELIDNLHIDDNNHLLLIKFIAENCEFYLAYFNNNLSGSAMEETLSLSQKKFIRQWTNDNSSLDTYKAEYLFEFINSSFLCIVKKWLQNGMKESPEEISTLINTLITGAVNALLKEIKTL